MARVVGTALQIYGALTGNPWVVAAGNAILIGDSYEQTRRARRRAQAEYNASLQDRLEMFDVQPDQLRTLVMGRVRTVEGIRRKWVSGENSQRLTMVVSFAGHEIDAFEQFYFNDIPVTLDASGYVLTEPFNKGQLETRTVGGVLNEGGSATLFFTGTPVPGSISARWRAGGGLGQGELSVIVGGEFDEFVTVSGGPSGAQATVYYQVGTSQPTARIRAWTGAPGQNVGAAIAAEYPGKITATDRFEGMAVAVVDIDYDPDIYVQGRPTVTAVLRGARVLDPRTSTTAWSENPALHAYHYARHANGWAVPAGEIRTADVIAAANACDVATAFTLRPVGGSPTVVNLPRYRSGCVIPLGSDPRESMDEIIEAMAGRWGWAGGEWRLRAGALAATVDTVTPAWLAQRLGSDGAAEGEALVSITNGIPRDQRINRISGRCVNPDERWQVLPFPAVQDNVLIAAKGVAPLEVDYSCVNHIAHAQHLGTITIRQAQAPLRLELLCNLLAWRSEIFDVLALQLPRYGFASNTAEVVGWRWHPTEGVTLKLAEIAAGLFTPVAELTGQDPAPNGSLPPPWQVEQLTGLDVTSGTVPLTDGSILTRTLVTWDPAISQSVRAGGKVQVQYIEAADTLPDDWPIWEETGASTSAIIPALRSGFTYLFRARFVSAPPLNVRGPWSVQQAHTIALPPAAIGRYTDIVFRRSVLQPATPTGTGTPPGWFDAPPGADGRPLWVSYADKNGDGSLIGVWTLPVQIDGNSLQVEYSVNGIDGWHPEFEPGDIYARYRVGNDGAWAVVKIVGEDGTTISYIFRRSLLQPATPTGDIPVGWFDEPPAPDGTPLWVSLGRKTPGGTLLGAWDTPIKIEGEDIQVEYSVNGIDGWHPVFVPGDKWARYRVGAAGDWSSSVKIVGEDGANGTRTALLEVYRWSAAAPTTFPVGTSVYTWATGNFTAPANLNGWALLPPAPVAGQTLWACSVRYADTNTTATSSVVWATSTPYPVGTASTPGSPGAQGRSRTVAYALYTGNPVVSGLAVVKSGTTTPVAGDFFPAAATNFSYLVPTPGTGQSVFQSEGIYDPVADTTTWNTPYLSNFRVGALSAITADLGLVTAGSISTSGHVLAQGGTGLNVVGTISGVPGITRTAAFVSNTSLAQDFGGVFYSSQSAGGGAGAYGYNGNSISGMGLAGRGGFYGVYGVGFSAGGYGVFGQAPANGFGVVSNGRLQANGRITVAIGSSETPLQLPTVSGTLPPPLAGGFTLHFQRGPIFSDGVKWYYFQAPIIEFI
jgi:hypothetical protein